MCALYVTMHKSGTLQCCNCTQSLAPDEAEAPYERDGHVWCDPCYHDEYEFICSWCEEYGDIAVQHRYVAVFDADEAEVSLPGLYRVDHAPYYTSGYVGSGWLHSRAVTWLGYLPPESDAEGSYPCGHFCEYCQDRALTHIAHATACGILAGMPRL